MLEADIAPLYRQRFHETQLRRRAAVWRVLAREWLGRYIPERGAVLELGAGYCEFINAAQAAFKVAVDVNLESRLHADKDVVLWQARAEHLGGSEFIGRFDVVFASNLLEHCASKDEVLQVLRVARRALKPSGRLILLGPNFRFCASEYFDFFDHQLALSDRSVVEAVRLAGLEPERVEPRTLPFTFGSRLPSWPWLVRLYVRLPFLWRLFGAQFLVVARRA